MQRSATIWLDHSHMSRRASGIERVTSELFNVNAMLPFKSKTYLAAAGRSAVIAAQMLGIPWAAVRNPHDVFVFPGYPPSPYFSLVPERSVLYVHDLFLLTRRQDLNAAGKYYMAPLFRLAMKRFKNFLTNSEDTARKLRAYCDPGALVLPYRPRTRNVLRLSASERSKLPVKPNKLKVVALGTIEPRKNYIAAADVCEELSARFRCVVELHIIGRRGWSDDARNLATKPNVRLHGFLNDGEAGAILNASDIYMCTSHEEGLCLPLLEAQHGGLAVVAPDSPVFREVLGNSGIFIKPDESASAASLIVQALSQTEWRRRHVEAAMANIERWNRLAERDRYDVLELFDRLTSDVRGLSSEHQIA